MNVNEISTVELQKLILAKDNYVLIDVREKAELIHGVIPSSRNIPLSELDNALKLTKTDFKKKYGVPKFLKNDSLICYCRSGSRSAMACDMLSSLGYLVLNYKGSILEWSKIDKNVKVY